MNIFRIIWISILLLFLGILTTTVVTIFYGMPSDIADEKILNWIFLLYVPGLLISLLIFLYLGYIQEIKPYWHSAIIAMITLIPDFVFSFYMDGVLLPVNWHIDVPIHFIICFAGVYIGIKFRGLKVTES